MSAVSASIVVSGVTVTTGVDISSPTVMSRIARIAAYLLAPSPCLFGRGGRRCAVAGLHHLGTVLLHHAAHLPHHLLVHLFHLPLHLLVHLLHLPLHLLHHLHHLRHAFFPGAGIRSLRQRRLEEHSQESEQRESGDHFSHGVPPSFRRLRGTRYARFPLVMGHWTACQGARAAALSLARIRKAGPSAWRNTASATEPNRSRPRPLRPCVVMAIRSASASRAPARISATGSPRRTSFLTRTPDRKSGV